MKLEFKKRKVHKLWRLNNIFLNNQWIREEITKEIRKYLEMDENTTYESIWDAVKAEGNLL